MNWIRNLRLLKSLAVFSIASGLILAMTVAGQSTSDPQQQRPEQPKQEQSKGAKESKQDPQKTKPAPEPEAETIHINTNLVAVPVSVTDAQGNPVRNLKVEDFHIEEEGVQQQIQTLGE